MQISKKILFITPYPSKKAPSQRFRFEQYLSMLVKQGHELSFAPFIGIRQYNELYTSGKALYKSMYLLVNFIKRYFQVFFIGKYDYIFIHREATPIGPPVFEFIASKIMGKKIIYDFDDAIWLYDKIEKKRLWSKLKWKSKVSKICRWSYKVSCGNSFLASYASQYAKEVIVNPTTIDTVNVHNPALHRKKSTQKLCIGWTGSHSTLPYLEIVAPILNKLAQKEAFTFLVISNQKPDLDLECMEFCKWNETTEIENLARIDIGLMPLTDNEWSKGKCGFKALQYMAMGIPAIASPVGVNSDIVEDKKNGFLCASTQDWHEAIITLIKNPSLREKMGQNGRQFVVDHYSVESNGSSFLDLFT